MIIMNIDEIEKTLRQIREKESYLIRLKRGDTMSVHSYEAPTLGIIIMGNGHLHIYDLSKDEKEYLKQSCIKEIIRLRESIKCLTE